MGKDPGGEKERFRDYVRRKLREHYEEEGIDLPSGGSGSVGSQAQRDLVDQWFERQQELRDAADRKKAEQDASFKERMKPIKRAERLAKDRLRKRQERLSAAGAEGRDLRKRADLSGMTEEEKAEHRRKMDRERKRRQRANTRMREDPDFGRF